MAKYDKADIERRMKGAVESLKGDLSGLRTGRANTSLLDPVVVEVYGSMMPLSQSRRPSSVSGESDQPCTRPSAFSIVSPCRVR